MDTNLNYKIEEILLHQALSYNGFLEVKNFGFKPQKFIRRPDLSTLDRIHIAQTALMVRMITKNNG